MSLGAELEVAETPAVLDPYGGHQDAPTIVSASDLIQDFRDRQEIAAQAAAVKQEIKEELLQEGTEYQWVQLADGEVNWDVLMAPASEEHGPAWAWVPQAHDMESDDEGLVLWEAPDQEALEKAWHEIASFLPAGPKLEPVTPVAPVPKMRAEPPQEVQGEGVEKLESVTSAKAKAKTRAKARRVVYQQPGVKPVAKTKVTPAPKAVGISKEPPPPPPPPPPVLDRVESVKECDETGLPEKQEAPEVVEEWDEWEGMKTEDGEEAPPDGTEESTPMATENDEGQDMAEHLKHLLLKSVDMPVPTEAAEREAAAFFRHGLWQELRRGPRLPKDRGDLEVLAEKEQPSVAPALSGQRRPPSPKVSRRPVFGAKRPTSVGHKAAR